MPLWHSEEKGDLTMYLYDRSQRHGNHNYSHFHVSYNKEDSVYDIKGNRLAGKCEIDKEITDFIKKHRNHIHKCLNKIVQGKEFNQVNDNIF